MERWIVFVIIQLLFSGLWFLWYNDSETLKSTYGTYSLFIPIVTLAVFFIALELIIRIAGNPL
jgi:hypothetical protein